MNTRDLRRLAAMQARAERAAAEAELADARKELTRINSPEYRDLSRRLAEAIAAIDAKARKVTP